MSKLRPIYVLIPGVVLIIATICVFVFVLLPPVNKEIQKVTQDRDTEQAKADERPQAEKRLEDAERKLKEQTIKLERYMKTRSIPISLYLPMEAMIKFWYELQEDLAPSLEKYIESSGCRIIRGAALPAPQMAPPIPGASNFIRIPQSGALQFTVQGTEAELRKLYTSLNQFDRVATIEPLSLQPIGGGEELQAEVAVVVYILAEGPEGAAAAPAGGAAAPGAGAAPGMPGMMGGPGAPGAGPPGGGAAGPKGGGAPKGDEGGGGAGSKLKGRDAEAGGDE
ncbi:MAG: hypothetical protein FJX75_03020 [Armatimonadetes bacterium]|nr:hypothetical protein [Armatimonadota bacterium]